MSENVTSSRPAWVNWMFADRETGRLVIAQFPNAPLWIFLGVVLVRFVASPTGAWGIALGLIADLALLWWAGDELIRGVNPWRRILGTVVAVFVVSNLIVALV